MPNRCGCANACSCLIVAGDGIAVEGIGTLENPYEITSESSDLVGRVEFTDEGNVDFTTTGVGTINDPLTVFADAVLAMGDLTDVPDTEANDGDILVWRLNGWVYEQPADQGPTLPPGGTDGQALLKQSSADGDALWETLPPSLPPGGTDGQVLTKQSSANGDALWEAVTGGGGGGEVVVNPTEYVILRANAAQSMANSVETSISYAAAVSDDPYGMWDGTTTVTVKSSGLYDITFSYGYAAPSTAGSRITLIKINGATWRQWYHPISGTTPVMGTVTFEVKLNAGDTVQARQYQSSGAAMDTMGATLAYAPSLFVSKQDPSIPAGGGGVIVDRPAYGAWYRSGSQTLTHNVSAGVIFDTVNVEPPQGMSIDSGGVITVAEAGLYSITAHLAWVANAVGNRYAWIYAGPGPSGVNLGRTAVATGTAAGNYSGITVAGTRWLNAGDVIRILAYQSSGANLDLFGDSTNRSLCVEVTRIPHGYSGSAVSTYGERNYMASRGHNTATSITNNVQTAVPYDTATVDDGIPWEASPTPGFRIPVAGYYDVEAVVSFTGNATAGARLAFIVVNNISIQAAGATPNTGASSTSVTVAATVKCAAGDLVEVRCQQTQGAALTLVANTAYNRMSITKIPAPVVNGAAASGVWGSGGLATFGADSLVGREIYIDSKGQLRGAPRFSGTAACTAATTAAVAMTNVTGMVVTVPVTGPKDVYLVTITFDAANLLATTATFIGMLVVGGALQTRQALWNIGGASGCRCTVSQTFLITGLAAGNTDFQGAIQCSVAGQFKVNTSHTTITVQQI